MGNHTISGKKHRREKAVLYAIIIILVIALVLSNIVWASRHNSETASAETPEIHTATFMAAQATEKSTDCSEQSAKKDWVNDVCMI